ncbi:hypothetical protein AAGW05_05875 [Arthrobacter sp. LAPM80]|uniref:hypothetical protein n=1 Tax=Arthrobacter sp. LAPM80 TaxID=3141788 RepID=UPI00398B5571
MSVEEYGVYKGSAGSAVKPVTSSVGLFVVSRVISVFAGISACAFAREYKASKLRKVRGMTLERPE